MDTVTISEYEEHVNKQLGILKQLFQGFEGSSDVSIDGMAVSRDNEIDAIVDRLVQRSHYGTNVNTEQSDSSNDSQQMEVLEAIRLSNDSLIPTLLRHSKELDSFYPIDATLQLPEVVIPREYYTSKEVTEDPAEKECLLTLLEIQVFDESSENTYFVPVSTTIDDWVRHLYPDSATTSFMVFMDGICYTSNSSNPSQLPTCLSSWLKQCEWVFLLPLNNSPQFDESAIQWKPASSVSFDSLALRVDHDHLILTVNDNRTYSEHRFTFKNVFSYTTGISSPDYSFVSNRSLRRGHFPLRIRNRIAYAKNCGVCGTREASYFVTNDVLVPTSPFFFCERCLSLFHYDDQGKLLTSPFNLHLFDYLLIK
ncbi:hypothetical protein WA588_001994 [Blastocystis sp. NMH]